MLILLLVGIVYFYFNWQYFNFVKKLMDMPNLRIWYILISFIINYSYFCLVSLLEVPLILNWILFAFLLLFETMFYNHQNLRCALFCTLIGIIFGLSVNILCRSIISIVLSQPLQRFDNNVTAVDNVKGIPVFLGFLIAGIVMQCCSLSNMLKRLQLIVTHPRHQIFILQMMTGLFIYLFLNLLLYSTPLNDTLLKIWSIKSCLFSLCGFYIALRYTRRICVLDDYREKNRRIEEELEKRRIEEKLLRQKAVQDALTGFYNRRYAEECLASLMDQQRFFTLCFLDLNGLKNVNDRYGHEEGDRFILTVTGEIRAVCQDSHDNLLFRYGGDEFLILFENLTKEEAEKRIRSVYERLHGLEADQLSTEPYPYPLSFSYGLAESTGYLTWKELVQAADQRMYRQKHKTRLTPAEEDDKI